jgi:KaiC/GvpD/RAD55 family RecA-like ATPase
MAKFLLHITRQALCKLIVLTLLNKFDFFLCIEGNTGVGKSTLAIHIARGVKAEFRRLYRLQEDTVRYYYERVIKKQMITEEEFCQYLLELKEKKAYDYNPFEDLIYDQKSMMRALSSWNRIFVPDEMVNITFNRDFQGDAQKKIIKLLNMYRDHCNLIIASVPQFQTLDIQVKNLTKMRVSVEKRGAGVLQTPNKVIYARDKWDSANNEKIEREWLLHGGKPKYTKLTTARGLIAFPPLTKRLFNEYQKIKNDKRSNIVEVEMGIGKEQVKKEPVEQIYDMLVEGKIRNSVELGGMALLHGMTFNALSEKLRRKLIKECKGTLVTEFYWDKKSKMARNRGNEDALVSLVR